MKRFVAWAINYKKRISGSLTAKTFLLLLALFLFTCSVAYLCIGLSLPYANERDSRGQLDQRTKALVAQLRQRPSSESNALLMRFMQETGADVMLVNAHRQPVDFFAFSAPQDDMPQGQEYPFRFRDADEEYILLVRYNPARSEEISGAIWRSMPWVGGMILALSVASALLFARYTTHPMIRMSKTAANIADLDFSWYCPDLREDEIGVLAKSLNELSDKLSEALATLRQKNMTLEDQLALEKEQERRRLLFFAGVSHELKTPIAIVIGQLEGMQAGIGVYKDKEKYLARSSEILRSLDGFIKEILSVSHMEIDGKRGLGAVNLSSLTEEAIDACRMLIESKNIDIHSQIPDNIFTSGDHHLLKKAIANVVSNAAAYSPESGRIAVTLSHSGGKAVLEVVNTPAHIEAEHLPHLFEAFYRADKNAEQGSGLGLYITRMILEAHAAAYKIENQGDGVKFTAVFNIQP